ncbi:MAG TPA: NrsF family protein [Roseiarcus sp.]|nr:NrsF family protein [Roseiarcus sp.]
MRTDELILALGADARRRGLSLPGRVLLALALGGCVSVAVFMAMVGPRPDIMPAMRTMRFDLKFLDTLALLAPALLLCLRMSRPEVSARTLLLWLLAPVALLAVAVAVELATVPSHLWMHKLIGTNWYHCLSLVPTLALPPLAALILALRAGAPRYPALTGALAGLAAAGVSATIYATSCADDSPLFVATWYPLGAGAVAGLGALAGRRWLTW